jgi:hypothetical protein
VLIDLTDQHLQRHPEASGPVTRFEIKQRFIIAQFQYNQKPIANVAQERTADLFSDDHDWREIMLVTKSDKRVA